MNDYRSCRQCGEPLQGRSDKKYCDDQCRSNYNNKINNYGVTEMRSINSILRKNRKILGEVIPVNGEVKIPKEKLYDKGFNFRYFTHTCAGKKGFIYKLCYDYAYLPLENDLVVVMKWGKE